MHTWIRRALCAVGLTGGVLLLGFGLAEAASADTNGSVTTGESGIVSGNQTGTEAEAPVTTSGNQVTVIGQENNVDTAGDPASGDATPADSGSGATTSGQDGTGSGNQTAVDAQAPVDASGNQVTVIGQGNAVDSTGGSSSGSGDASGTGPTTSGDDGAGSGNQSAVDAQAPVDASGNQLTVIGQDNTSQSSGGSSTGSSAGGTGPTTSGDDGAGSGNQTPVDAQAPVDASGNQVTVIGQGNTVDSTGGRTSGTPGGGTIVAPQGAGAESPPVTGGSGTTESPQAGLSPAAGVLPDTGAPTGLIAAGLAGLLLLLGGLMLSRRGVSASGTA